MLQWLYILYVSTKLNVTWCLFLYYAHMRSSMMCWITTLHPTCCVTSGRLPEHSDAVLLFAAWE